MFQRHHMKVLFLYLGRQAGGWRWKQEQERLAEVIAAHQHSNDANTDVGVRILELSQSVAALFVRQDSRQKRQMLQLVFSNCVWKQGELRPEFRQPFDIFVNANRDITNKNAAQEVQDSEFGNWSAFVDDYRTLCFFPPPEVKRLFHDIRKLKRDNQE